MLKQIERKIGHLAIPHLTIYLIAGQALFFLAHVSNPAILQGAVLVPREVLAGEWWRLLAFVFIPPTTSIIFIIFALYLLWLMGEALEQNWGAFRYNLFLLVGYLATISSIWLQPSGEATNVYLLGSIFLAFALLYPDFQILLFFIVPVKVKWLALFAWAVYAITFLTAATNGQWMHCILILAAIGNILLFFWPDLLAFVRRKGRQVKQQTHAMEMRRVESEPFHRCTVCGRTEESDPELEFRYCPECTGSPCYCVEHIFDHEHK